MLLSRVKDFKLRKKFLRLENKIKLNKFVLINLLSRQNNLKTKLNISFLLKSVLKEKKTKKKSKTKITRRCLINDRTKSVSRPLNLSRSVFRDLLQFGIIPGYKKAIW